MSLYDVNVDKLLEEHYTKFFTQEKVRTDSQFIVPLSFNCFKPYILMKEEFTFIMKSISTELTEIQKKQKEEEYNTIYEKHYTEQVTDDENENNQYATEFNNLNNKIEEISKNITELSSERKLLEQKLLQPIILFSNSTHTHPHNQSSSMTVNAHHHMPQPSNYHEHSSQNSENDQTSHLIRVRIKDITTSISNKEHIIQDIEQKKLRLNSLKEEREARLNNRSKYNEKRTLDNLKQTLSKKRIESLEWDIVLVSRKIDKKYKTIHQQVKQQKDSKLIEILPNHLDNLEMAQDDKEALGLLLHLMNQYLIQVKKSKNFSGLISTLEEEKNKLNNQLINMRENRNEFEKENQKLGSQNTYLIKKNEVLPSEIDSYYANFHKNLWPGLGFLGLGLASAIPLALTFAGIIPYIVAPVIMLPILAGPPAVLLIIGLGLAIAALTYFIISSNKSNLLKQNEQTISNNQSTIISNNEKITNLESKAIPEQYKRIEDNQKNLEDAQNQLELSNSTAKNFLETAQKVDTNNYKSIKPSTVLVEQNHPSIVDISIFANPNSKPQNLHEHPSHNISPSAPEDLNNEQGLFPSYQ